MLGNSLLVTAQIMRNKSLHLCASDDAIGLKCSDHPKSRFSIRAQKASLSFLVLSMVVSDACKTIKTLFCYSGLFWCAIGRFFSVLSTVFWYTQWKQKNTSCPLITWRFVFHNYLLLCEKGATSLCLSHLCFVREISCCRNKILNIKCGFKKTMSKFLKSGQFFHASSLKVWFS